MDSSTMESSTAAASMSVDPGPSRDAAQLQALQGQVREMAARDREVRAHEAAHAAVGGAHAGSPVYETQRGPNGIQYAVSGHVSIDVSPVAGDPEATVEKMRTVRRAALAPANPSSQDRAVAAQAARAEQEARREAARVDDETSALAGDAEISQSRGRGPTDTRGSVIDEQV